MDPISMMMLGTSAIGMGMQLFGTNKASADASAIAQQSAGIAQDDIKVNAQRQQQMVLQSNRAQMQNIRNTQMARSQAESGAVNQGAQFGSGLSGGLAQISGESNTNALNNSQNLQIGQNIFGLDNDIDQHRIAIASLQGSMASAQGTAAMGGDIMKGASAFSSVANNAFGSKGGGNGAWASDGGSWYNS